MQDRILNYKAVEAVALVDTLNCVCVETSLASSTMVVEYLMMFV